MCSANDDGFEHLLNTHWAVADQRKQMIAHLRETLTWQGHAWMDFLRTVPQTLPSYHHAVARHSRLPKPLALLASLLVYSEGGREGAGCVWVSTCQRQLMFLRRPRHVLNNASSTRIDPLAIDCATPRDQRDPTASEPMRHTPTMWENHLPRSRSDLGTETSERVWGCASVFAGTGLDRNHVPGGLLQRPGADAR